MVDRRHARVLAMQALCQWDVQHDTSSTALYDFLHTHTPEHGAVSYAGHLAASYWGFHVEADRRLQQALEKWDLGRLSSVDRNVMRVALTEWLLGEVPRKVALNEAIEVAAAYGGAESSRFVNGVLDRILKELPPETVTDRPRENQAGSKD